MHWNTNQGSLQEVFPRPGPKFISSVLHGLFICHCCSTWHSRGVCISVSAIVISGSSMLGTVCACVFNHSACHTPRHIVGTQSLPKWTKQSWYTFFFIFLRVMVWHMEVPRLGVKLELQLLAAVGPGIEPESSWILVTILGTPLVHLSRDCQIHSLPRVQLDKHCQIQ